MDGWKDRLTDRQTDSQIQIGIDMDIEMDIVCLFSKIIDHSVNFCSSLLLELWTMTIRRA